jgi:hypothetical protein
MNLAIPIKKLFRIAAYTSTAIGLITMGPVYVMAVIMANIKTTYLILIKLLFSSAIGISFFIFIIWLINIVLLYYSRTRTFLFRKKNTRYIVSYLLCFILLFSIRLLVTPVINDPGKVQKIIEWKTNFFGIDPVSFDFMQFSNWIFQILIMVFMVVSIN